MPPSSAPIRTGGNTSGKHRSHWTSTVKPLGLPVLQKDLDVDVVVVGGGIAGLSVAYQLGRSGKRVALVEDGEIGSGETGRTSAHLSFALDDGFARLEKLFGKKDAALIAESHVAAVQEVERIVNEERIACDFKRLPGYLVRDPSDDADALVRERKAAARCGIRTELVEEVPGIKGFAQALRFADQGRFHPLRYLNGLAEAVLRQGGLLFAHSHADKVTKEGVEANGHHIRAAHVVVATNSPVVNKYWVHLLQSAYRTYMVGALVPKDSLPDALWWDTGDHARSEVSPPYHYVRTAPYDEEHDLLLCGGEDHAIGNTTDIDVPEEGRYALLERWVREHFEVSDFVHHWSGQVLEPIDAIAFIGRDPFNTGNVYIATGDSGHGLTHGTIAGLLLTNLITGKEDPWEKVYSPSRQSMLRAGKTFVKEFFGGFISYLKDKDKPHAGLSGMGGGEAELVKLDGRNYGAYKDDAGDYHLVGSECTHLKCIVKWNGDEKTWDCPCHGSRFTYMGLVLNGPANHPLPYHRLAKRELETPSGERSTGT
jgi:glycine/D-amino acid oxidase-like deaminating enzyme/nitrite reductase/ring-hydroxylating ferredoxin subunit